MNLIDLISASSGLGVALALSMLGYDALEEDSCAHGYGDYWLIGLEEKGSVLSCYRTLKSLT